MCGPGAVVQRGLTAGQAALLERHCAGLLRLAGTLAARNGIQPDEVMLVLADRKGRIGNALSAALPSSAIGPAVLPGRTAELVAWVERLAAHGPVWDLQDGSTGSAVIVIDADDAMAVVRLDERAP